MSIWIRPRRERRTEWNLYCGSVALQRSNFGQIVTVNGRQYRIEGIVPRNPVWGIIGYDLAIKKYVWLRTEDVFKACPRPQFSN